VPGKTKWHRVVIYSEGLAKVAEQYLEKDSRVYIEGRSCDLHVCNGILLPIMAVGPPTTKLEPRRTATRRPPGGAC
jgi:Single-strand binding protein family